MHVAAVTAGSPYLHFSAIAYDRCLKKLNPGFPYFRTSVFSGTIAEETGGIS